MRARNRLAVLVALLALLGVAVAGHEANAILAGSLDSAFIKDSARDAQLAADLGLAGALADGRLAVSDERVARHEVDAMRRSHPLTSVTVWPPAGAALFSDPAVPRQRRPGVVARAFAERRLVSGRVADSGPGGALAVAVPMDTRRERMVAEFRFSRLSVDHSIAVAKQRLMLVIGAATLVLALALVPLTRRLVRMLPTPIDPARKRALADLRRGIAAGELRLDYQPKLAVGSERVVGVEALVRWEHPARGRLLPAEFLPVAESSEELLLALTAHNLDEAIRVSRGWADGGYEIPVAVNVAVSSLHCRGFTEMVATALARHSLPARLLTIEVTESALMEHHDSATAVLQQLRATGVRIAIDDFGTGYSSLERLRSLPLNELKIDRSFVGRIGLDARDRAIAQMIVNLARSLDLDVVAEGVESHEELSYLISVGCPVVQGYLISRPLPAPRVLPWVRARCAPQA